MMVDRVENVAGDRKVSAYALLLNYFPILYLGAGALVALTGSSFSSVAVIIILWIYFFPPLICRGTLLIFGRPEGRAISQYTRAYRVWWFLTQLQMLFNRIPWLEEILRLLPGAYGLWLNLWGGRVSLVSYWAPEAKVVDRYLLHVEKEAVIGAQARLTGHLGRIGPDGNFVVDIAPVTICRGAMVGAAAGLGPGCRVAENEEVSAGRFLPPYTLWQGGRKIKNGASPE